MYFSCVYQKKVLLLQALFNRALSARKKFDFSRKRPHVPFLEYEIGCKGTTKK